VKTALSIKRESGDVEVFGNNGLFLPETTSTAGNLATRRDFVVGITNTLQSNIDGKVSVPTNAPLCSVCLGFFQRANPNASGLMLHAPVHSNSVNNPVNFMTLPFEVKVYAVSLSLDTGSATTDTDYAERTYTFQVANGSLFTFGGFNGTTLLYEYSLKGSEAIFTNVDEGDCNNTTFSTQATISANNKLGLLLNITDSNGNAVTSGAEVCVKLWCYQT
jgi:hypothetical protein